MLKIYIDAGHSEINGDPGAVSGTFIEYRLNKRVAEACRDYLTANYDCIVYIDYNNSVTYNCNKAKELGCDIFLCIHHNAGGGDGCEVFYWYTDMKSKAFAEELIRQFITIGQNSRGAKPSTPDKYNFGPCRINSANGIIGILGEFAFVDNNVDRIIIDSDAELVAEGKAYALAVAKYFGLVKFSETPITPPTTTVETYDVVTKIKGYTNSANAKANINPTVTVDVGTYYIFNKAVGMINVTKDKTLKKPGSWINPADNVVPPVVITPPITTTPPIEVIPPIEVTPPAEVTPPIVVTPTPTPEPVKPPQSTTIILEAIITFLKSLFGRK
jgi:hypothetical protein